MKNIVGIFIFICTLGLIGCNNAEGDSQESVNKDRVTIISESSLGADILFDTLVNDLGKLIEGEQVLCYYRYQNAGDQPLLIHSIKAGCGCTVPEWSDEPLEAGKNEAIKVLFNSSGKSGNQNIRITVNSNSKNPVSSLILKAVVN